MSMMLQGTGAVPGIAMGRAYVMEQGQPEIAEYEIPDYLVDAEIERYNDAVRSARDQLRELREGMPEELPHEITEFIDAHLLMLEDSAIARAPVKIIRKQKRNAEWALKQQRDALVHVFEEMDDPYLSTRKDDIDHVVNRVLRILLQQEVTPIDSGDDGETVPRIVVADDLAPADVATLQAQKVQALVTEYGTPSAHSAILARSLGIPMVVGLTDAHRYLRDGEKLLVDGETGMLIADPDERSLEHFRRKQQRLDEHRAALGQLQSRAPRSLDGVEIALRANIELSEDLDQAHAVGANGVGLFRTEYLYLRPGSEPDEEAQFQAYSAVLEQLRGAPLTIRTLDIGPERMPNSNRGNARVAVNPALGLRGIRLCLRDPSLFIPQIRAILRAAALGPIRMMIPMVTQVQELRQVRDIVAQERTNLTREGVAHSNTLEIGAMIETPAAALAADCLAQEADFLSIGTNDLTQYTLVIDRNDDQVNYLNDPLHPAILRLIQNTLQAGERFNKPVAMCGELAGDTRYTRILLGLGLRELSMSPASIPGVKQILLGTDIGTLRTEVANLMQCTDPNVLREHAERINHGTQVQ
jgi:phosphotransferase system enzyme I (PtsI)